mgnify:CR=1 FL=1
MPKYEPEHQRNREVRTSKSESANQQIALHERLKQIRSALAMPQPKMDELLGLGKQSWQKYESAGVAPGSKVIQALVEQGWNANWILTGEGPERLGEIQSASGPAVSGGMEDRGPIQALSLRSEWLENRGIRAQDVAVTVFPDDSMAPTIKKGDLVLADKARADLIANGLYMVEHMRQRTVVRLILEPDGTVTRILDNVDRPNPEMSRERIEPYIIGTVFWIGGER